METTILNGYEINRYRKKITKFVQRLTDRACNLLIRDKSLEEVSENLHLYMNEIEYHGSIYVTYFGACEWNDKEYLYIRNSNGDYTLVSITPVKEDQEQ
jgi:hypothetical protein